MAKCILVYKTKGGGGGGGDDVTRITTKPQYLLENKNEINMMHANIENTHTHTHTHTHKRKYKHVQCYFTLSFICIYFMIGARPTVMTCQTDIYFIVIQRSRVGSLRSMINHIIFQPKLTEQCPS